MAPHDQMYINCNINKSREGMNKKKSWLMVETFLHLMKDNKLQLQDAN